MCHALATGCISPYHVSNDCMHNREAVYWTFTIILVQNRHDGETEGNELPGIDLITTDFHFWLSAFWILSIVGFDLKRNPHSEAFSSNPEDTLFNLFSGL